MGLVLPPLAPLHGQLRQVSSIVNQFESVFRGKHKNVFSVLSLNKYPGEIGLYTNYE